MGMSFHKEGECRSIPAKPTGIKKQKDIPRLPEKQKKLYQYFRLFYFHSHNNIAVISLLLHVVDTYQIRITPQYIFIQILRTLYVALWDGTFTWRARAYLAAYCYVRVKCLPSW